MGKHEVIVVDTHIIIWDALKPEKLSQKAKETIISANNSDGIIFCEISLWEIAMLMHKGRLAIDLDYLEFIRLVSDSNRYIFHGISPEIAELSAKIFSSQNKDPADKIIAATSIINNAELITADKGMLESQEVATIW
jgi:PIN domain nuclease of toxin-antitoxin system